MPFRGACGAAKEEGEQVGASGESKMDEGLSTPYPKRKSLEGMRTLGGHQQLCAYPEARLGVARRRAD